MGQHKHNPTAQLAKEGKLPPKERQMGKRELDRMITREIERVTGITQLRRIMGGGYSG